MSDMKCPFCNKKLEPIGEIDTKYPTTDYYCPNNCMPFAFGNLPMWNKLKHLSDKIGKLENDLERTRKALDVATKCINWVIDTFQKGLEHESDVVGCCELSLERIEELEQKDVK